MRKTDVFLILFVIVVAAGFYFSGVLRPSQEGAYAVVYVDGEEYQRYSLKKNGVYPIELHGHQNIIQIQDGYVDMIDADCPDKLCVQQRKIHYNHETIVCLPHKMVVEIKGGETSPVDVVAE